MGFKIKLPEIPEIEKTPLVSDLLIAIEQQVNIIGQLTEQIQLLKDEIARLKNQPPRPKIKPSSLENKAAGKKKRKGKKRPGSKKRKKQPNCKFTKLFLFLWRTFHKEPCLKDISHLLFRGLGSHLEL